MKRASVFVFNEDSHLEGIMHYSKELNSAVNDSKLWRLNQTSSADEAYLEEENGLDEENESEEDYLEDEAEDLEEDDEEDEEYDYFLPDDDLGDFDEDN